MSQTEIVASPSSSKKSLKQARLPFQLLDRKTAFFNVQKKRKLSNSDSNNEVKIQKTEIVTNTENDGNSVNTELRDASLLLKHNEETKPCKEVILVDLDTVEINLSNINSDIKSSTVIKENCNQDNDAENSSKNLLESKKCEENINPIKSDDSIESVLGRNINKKIGDSQGAELSTTLESVEEMSCDEGVINSTLNTSSLSLSESDIARTETSELDRSQLATEKKTEENLVASPVVKKRKVSKTPLSAKKLEEQERRKQEKLRLRSEKERQLQESRDAKRRAKEAEKDQKEVLRNIAKQQKKKELEEKQSKKQAELNDKLKAKEEEKAKKLEATQAKLEDKKRKEEEKQRKKEEKQKEEDEKLRKLEEKKKLDSEVSAKSKAVFANFFIKNASSQAVSAPEEPCGLFKPFEITKNMVLASITPVDIISQFDKKNLDGCFLRQDTKHLYLKELRNGGRCPYKRTKKNHKSVVEDDVVIIEDSAAKGSIHRAKLYQFCENIRPPYYGTWTKTSQVITPRKPFIPDTKFFDYEVDSEEEWDEGGPGESLSGTEEEKESEDDYEVDNEFFVPHGYLSADEDQDEEEIATDTAEHQARLKMREREFQEERKLKFSELKPRVVGCVWLSVDDSCLPHQEELYKVLSCYKAVLLTTVPIQTSVALQRLTPSKEEPDDKAKTTPKSNNKVPEEAIPHFIRLVHANTRSRQILIKEFRQYWTEHRIKEGIINIEPSTNQLEKEVVVSQTQNSTPTTPVKQLSQENLSMPISPNTTSYVFNAGFSKRQLELTLSKIASYGRCPNPNFMRCVWWVHEEIRTKYDCLDLPVPNKWVYVSQKSRDHQGSGRRKAVLLGSNVPDKLPTVDCESSPKTDPNNSILKFTCKMSPSERFETNLPPVTMNKPEVNSPISVNKATANSILKFTRKITAAERFKSNLQSVTSDSKIDSNHALNEIKSCNGSPSILKFTRKITPIRVDVPTSDKSVTEKLPMDAAKELLDPVVIEIDDSNN